MNDKNAYDQFCPVARAAEIVASRWTPILLRELLAGSTKFNELRKGLAKMSPSLLTTRLNELEEAGIIRKEKIASGRGYEYSVTESGRELTPFVMSLGIWGQRYVIKDLAKSELDPGLLMWDIHRRIDTSYFPARGRFVASFYLKDAPSNRRMWWILVVNQKVDLCTKPPGDDLALEVNSELKALTEIWMGKVPIDIALKKGLIHLEGEQKYIRNFKKWFLLSPFASYSNQ